MYNTTRQPHHDQTIIEEDFDTDNNVCYSCLGRLFCFKKRRKMTSHGGLVDGSSGNDEDNEGFLMRSSEESWVTKKLKEVKEMSEVVAGPKWKNFIRKFGGYFSGNRRRTRRQDFQYDSFEYALNFDDDDDEGVDDQDRLRFSTKYANPFQDHAQRSTGTAS